MIIYLYIFFTKNVKRKLKKSSIKHRLDIFHPIKQL